MAENVQNNETKKVKYDKENFKIRVYAVVPPNYALATTNMFTGKTASLGPGMHFIAPWNKSIYVSTTTESIDYPKREFEVMDKFNVIVDYAVEVRVSDPDKFVFATEGNNAKEMLEKRLDALMFALARSSHYNELATMNVDLNRSTDPRIINIKDDLDEFTALYGLEVRKLNIKSVDQTPEMSKKFQEQKEQEIENQKKESAALAELNAQKKKVDAIAYEMKILKEQGLSKDEILDIIKTRLMVDSGNAQFMNISGDNTNATTFGAQFQAGANMVNNKKGSEQQTKRKL